MFKNWKPFTYWVFGIFVVLILIWIAIPNQLGSRRVAWNSRAKGTLRSLGSSQLAYQGTNNEKVYGTYEAMKKDLYIHKDYTLGNMITAYSMTWEVATVSTVGPEGEIINAGCRFEMVAYPTVPNNRFETDLYTFAITEDQIVRRFSPNNGNDPYDVRTWDPIL